MVSVRHPWMSRIVQQTVLYGSAIGQSSNTETLKHFYFLVFFFFIVVKVLCPLYCAVSNRVSRLSSIAEIPDCVRPLRLRGRRCQPPEQVPATCPELQAAQQRVPAARAAELLGTLGELLGSGCSADLLRSGCHLLCSLGQLLRPSCSADILGSGCPADLLRPGCHLLRSLG